MYAILQNANPKKVYLRCSKLRISYYSYNDNRQSLTIDGGHYREKANLLSEIVEMLPSEIEESSIVCENGLTDEAKEYLKL